MNISMIIYILGCVLDVEGVFLIFPALIGLLYHESGWTAFLIMAAVCILLGLAMSFKKPKNTRLYAKEGFVIVALSWIVMSIAGCLPFVINGDIPSFISALFETVSGFTTTGATNLTDIEALSKASLFWRSETHWLGGVGVVVFILGIVQFSGGQSIQLMRAESPGPSTDKLRPKMRYTALILYAIYTVLTLIQFVALLICKMPWFDALTTALATAGTGGFAVKNAGMAAYANPAAEIVIAVFMMLFGVNFNIYYLVVKRKFKDAFKNEEFIVYCIIVTLVTVFISLNVRSMFASTGETVRTSFFTVTSIISSTGFSTADFNLWPGFSKLLLMLIMFCGACAGSTGGGMKVIRIIVLVKAAFKEITHAIRPRSVSYVKVDGKKVSDKMVKAILTYFTIEMLMIAGSILAVSLDNLDTTTTVTSVITCIHNIGPGLNLVGPTGSFAMYSGFSKVILIFDMLAGRLELLPMLVLFNPGTWKRD